MFRLELLGLARSSSEKGLNGSSPLFMCSDAFTVTPPLAPKTTVTPASAGSRKTSPGPFFSRAMICSTATMSEPKEWEKTMFSKSASLFVFSTREVMVMATGYRALGIPASLFAKTTWVVTTTPESNAAAAAATLGNAFPAPGAGIP